MALVERKMKCARLARINDKSAETVTETMVSLLEPDCDSVLRITADNGKEFADYEKVRDKLGCAVYFADPYCLWQRGLNGHAT